MSPDEARAAVEHIRSIRGDDEMAHLEEDRLRVDVLQHIADGGDNAAELAGIALSTESIEFSRWYA